MSKIDIPKLLEEHKEASKECTRKRRKDKGVKRESYKSILPTKYRSYLMRANAKGIEFEFSLEEFNQILSHSCVYCGSSGGITIDRIDSKQGYTAENTNPCCYNCNMMKHFANHEQFLRQVKKIYDFSFKGKINEDNLF